MKLVTYLSAGRERLGALSPDGEAIVDLQGVSQSAIALLEGGEAAMERARETARAADAKVALADAALLSPVPRPASIRECMVFEAHITNCIRLRLGPLAPLDERLARLVGTRRSLAGRLNAAFYELPPYYKANTRSVVGTGAEVRIPPYTEAFDYELEFGIFIGRQGVDIPKERAREHIAGYAVFNDFSARDIQVREMRGRLGPAKGKDFDTGNSIGPWLVTADEIPDPYDLTMIARVNGEEWSRGTSADMHYSFEELIAYISRSETLYPGDFIGSGTCSGSQGKGCGLELGRFLSSGDTVELEVEGIGILRNTVS